MPDVVVIGCLSSFLYKRTKQEGTSSYIIMEGFYKIQRRPFKGSGKPEPLKHNLPGWWSGRTDLEHRLVTE
jgi:Txe/YoeB family toxin of toxin-antitoxin system